MQPLLYNKTCVFDIYRSFVNSSCEKISLTSKLLYNVIKKVCVLHYIVFLLLLGVSTFIYRLIFVTFLVVFEECETTLPLLLLLLEVVVLFFVVLVL